MELTVNLVLWIFTAIELSPQVNWHQRKRLIRGVLMETNDHSSSLDPRWWEAPGSLLAVLLRLDGEVGAMVHAE